MWTVCRTHLVSNISPEIDRIAQPELFDIDALVVFRTVREDRVQELDVCHAVRIYPLHDHVILDELQ